MMKRQFAMLRGPLVCAAVAVLAVPAFAGDSATFDKSFAVTAPVRLEVSNGSGNVEIRGSADGVVHIHGKVMPGGWSIFGGSGKSVEEVAANPPIEQSGNTIRIGKNVSWLECFDRLPGRSSARHRD